MAHQSSPGDRLIDRRTVLQVGVALATAGPALLRRTPAEAQPHPRGASPVPIIDSQVHAYTYCISRRNLRVGIHLRVR